MSKRMFIDASHPEETRVVVMAGNKIEEFDFEAASRRPLKGNIYLAKVTRVEPSLQAAFVEYGGNRQGFLAFSEIHPDYYQIPVADRQALIEAQSQRRMDDDDIESFDSIPSAAPGEIEEATESTESDEHADNLPPTEVEAESVVEVIEPADDGQSDDHDFHEDVAAQGVGTSEADAINDAADDQAAHDHAAYDHDHDHDDSAGEHEADALADMDAGAIVHEHSDDGDEYGHDGDDDEFHDAPEQHEADALTDLEAGAEVHEDDVKADVLAEATGVPAPSQRHEQRRDRPRGPRRRPYKIQEVIKRRQIMLVQVVKEERGNKGAALTTFLSLAGRYCVLMPNTPRGGGISRKITNAVDRRRLKSAVQTLEMPQGMGLIIRTAGANRTKIEIKRDYEYLLRLWDSVRELTLKSNAPALVYEEGNLIKRAIRDLYNRDISEITVDGGEGYREAKDFMRMLMPSHAKNVLPYSDPSPLFQRHHIDAQLDAMFSPTVTLKSGGYIVINQTEALVSIDVNSGKATREHNIEDTATKTNLEAADEIARQLRLRDLAGLIVIDFIDMEDGKNDRHVEKRLRDALRGDRARVQVGRISQFGLMEMSRQRLRAGVVAGSTVTCPHCGGQGIVRSTESAALRLLRALDEEGAQKQSVDLLVKAPSDVVIYTLNQKRRELARIEEAYDLAITFEPQTGMMGGTFEITRVRVRTPSAQPKALSVSPEAGLVSAADDMELTDPAEDEMPSDEIEDETAENDEFEGGADADQERAEHQAGQPQHGEPGDGRRRRRRRRRGGRGRNGRPHESGETHVHAPAASADAVGTSETAEEQPHQTHAEGQHGEDGGSRRRRRRRRGRRHREGDWSGQHQNGQQQNFTDAPNERGEASAADLPTAAATTPNASSQPQWSFSPEQTAPTPMRANEPEPPRTAAPEAEAPREQRKGWWQRRFKIGQ